MLIKEGGVSFLCLLVKEEWPFCVSEGSVAFLCLLVKEVWPVCVCW